MPPIDELLPAFQQRTLHCRRVAALPEAAVAAARVLTVEEVRGLRPLLGLRALPAVAKRGAWPAGRGSLVDLALRYGFGILADEPRAYVLGLVGQPWRFTGGEVIRFADAQEYVAFDRPGFVKVAADFGASPDGTGSVLCTETRVAATDDETARRFARYWAVIRPFGGMLRRSMLAAVERRLAR